MDEAVYHTRGITLEFATDRPGIEWLRDNVNGAPVVVEAQWDLYTWANRVSIYTGLPTILGWDWHQTQQRHGLSLGGATATRGDQRFLHDPATWTQRAISSKSTT